jgi:hypothetical protein
VRRKVSSGHLGPQKKQTKNENVGKLWQTDFWRTGIFATSVIHVLFKSGFAKIKSSYVLQNQVSCRKGSLDAA